jgi:predicted glycoside hydrolase/deacetylase ChbG (UPF0249 family)
MTRRLVVNADDLGLTAGVNDGIVEAHVRGIVTSASLMVRQPAAADAACLARAHPRLGVGLHLDLGEWAYRDGGWVALYTVVDVDDEAAVTAEVVRQVECFQDLVGRSPTHLDSHQHVHDDHPVSSVVSDAARGLGVPVRGRAHRYVGSFYGQLGTGEAYPEGITVEALVELLRSLPDGDAELGCHPARTDGLAATGTMYVTERLVELRALCDTAVRDTVAAEGIELVTFGGLR